MVGVIADGPNGMVITPDNSSLIISESFAGRLAAFDIALDGSLSNRRAWAEGLGPDGICIDAEGAVWVQTADTRAHGGQDDAPEGAVVRIREGGGVLDRVEHDRAIFAAMLGGPDGTTLFLLAAQWRGIEHVDEALAARTGQILTTSGSSPRRTWRVGCDLPFAVDDRWLRERARRPTLDLDVVPDPARHNLERLAGALGELHAVPAEGDEFAAAEFSMNACDVDGLRGCGLGHLRTMTKAAGRPRALDDLEHLP